MEGYQWAANFGFAALERKDSILLAMTQRLPELPPPDRLNPDRDRDVTGQAGGGNDTGTPEALVEVLGGLGLNGVSTQVVRN